MAELPRRLFQDQINAACGEIAAEALAKLQREPDEPELDIERREQVRQEAFSALGQLELAVAQWQRQPLPSDHPQYASYFGMTRTLPEAARRQLFGDLAIDAGQAGQQQEGRAVVAEAEVETLGKENAALRKTLSHLQQALTATAKKLKKLEEQKRRSTDQRRRAQAPRPRKEDR